MEAKSKGQEKQSCVLLPDLMEHLNKEHLHMSGIDVNILKVPYWYGAFLKW